MVSLMALVLLAPVISAYRHWPYASNPEDLFFIFPKEPERDTAFLIFINSEPCIQMLKSAEWNMPT